MSADWAVLHVWRDLAGAGWWSGMLSPSEVGITAWNIESPGECGLMTSSDVTGMQRTAFGGTVAGGTSRGSEDTEIERDAAGRDTEFSFRPVTYWRLLSGRWGATSSLILRRRRLTASYCWDFVFFGLGLVRYVSRHWMMKVGTTLALNRILSF